MSSANEGKPIRCKAAVSWALDQPLSIQEVEIAPPAAGEVRVHMQWASICHTDISTLHGLNMGPFSPKAPFILGHEGVGIVESVGPNVTAFKIGDVVMPCMVPQCRKCVFCLNCPNTPMCASSMVPPAEDTRVTGDGKPLRFAWGCGTFSQYTVCREESITKVNPNAPKDKIAPFCCGAMTGYGAAVNGAAVKPGQSCAVWGVGSVGLCAIMGCKKNGAGQIIAIDINPAKFEIAKKFGATLCLNPKDTTFEEQLKAATNGLGPDIAIECVGAPSILKSAVESTNPFWGKTVAIGAASVDTELKFTNSTQFMLGRSLIGCPLGGRHTLDNIAALVDEYMAGQLPIDDLLTHRVKLDDMNKAFEMVERGEAIKIMVDMS